MGTELIIAVVTFACIGFGLFARAGAKAAVRIADASEAHVTHLKASENERIAWSEHRARQRTHYDANARALEALVSASNIRDLN